MMIVNPFTRQVLNANPKGCNQHTGPRCARDSYEQIERFAGRPVIYTDIFPPYYAEANQDHVLAGAGKFERELAAHEIGHILSGHLQKPEATDPDDRWKEHAREEQEAWRRAIKDAKKLGVSRRKLRRIARTYAIKAHLRPNLLLANPKTTDYGKEAMEQVIRSERYLNGT